MAWPFTQQRLVAGASLVTIVGLPLAVLQLCDLREQRTLRAIQVAMYADQQLNSGSSVKIRHAIEKRRPILEENGGAFTREELSDYLDIFEALSDAYDRGQISRELLYIWHSYAIARAYEKEEIKRFVAEERKEDPDFYTGFEALGKVMLAEEQAFLPKPKRVEHGKAR